MKAVAKTRKVQTNKTNYLSDDAFADLKEALEGALAYEQGAREDLNVSRIQARAHVRQCHLKTLLAYDKSSTAHRQCLR